MSTEPRKLSYCEALEHMRKGGKVCNSGFREDTHLRFDTTQNAFILVTRIEGCTEKLERREFFSASEIYDADWTVYEELKPQNIPYHFLIELRGFNPITTSDGYLLIVFSEITKYLGDKMRSVGFACTEINITQGNTNATPTTPATE
jgi:hypothetical protein